MSYNQANTSSNSNLSDTTVLNCSTYLWKRFPGQDFYHFFHDMQAIIMAIANLQHTMNTSITNCKNITMIVSKQKRFNYKQSVYKQLFKFHRISHEQYIASPNSTYECGYHYSGIYFNDKNYVKSQFQQYIIHKLSLKMSLNPTDILIIDRRKTRHIQNVHQLQTALSNTYPNRSVRLVYFEDLSLREQYQLVMNASVIITPHGAAETAFIMINESNKNVKIIELCPPYAHCGFADNRMCPRIYKQYYRNMFLIGIGIEDKQWDCPRLAQYVGKESRRMTDWIKIVPEINVCIDCILSVVNGTWKGSRMIHKKIMNVKEKQYFINWVYDGLSV